MLDTEVDHLAYSILHGTFERESPGGCSCRDCTHIWERIELLKSAEAAAFYEEHYPPSGGLL
jgi:hypothetical protein